jgi:hypothetical protein
MASGKTKAGLGPPGMQPNYTTEKGDIYSCYMQKSETKLLMDFLRDQQVEIKAVKNG